MVSKPMWTTDSDPEPVDVEMAGLRGASDDEVRAAVVPLLDLEAAAERFYNADDTYPERWGYQAEDVKDWYRRMARIAVYAALGLGEESEGGEK